MPLNQRSLRRGADPPRNESGRTGPVLYDLRIIHVNSGVAVDIRNEAGKTPLDRAVGSGEFNVTRLLLDNGAKVDVTDGKGWTPLHSASHGGYLDAVKLLLRRDADVEARTRNNAGNTAEDVAWENSFFEVASFLAEYRSDADFRDISLLDISDPDPIAAEEESKEKEKTTLHKAAEEGKAETVRSLLDQGEDVNSKNAGNKTALDLATSKGHLDVVRLLIEQGATVDSRDRFGWTPLHKALRYGHLEVSRELMRSSATART
jgi:ankyrin repeat protein